MAKTKIEWTETSWNPVTGCTKISPGCLNCYAERMAYRLKSMGNSNYKNGFQVVLQEHMLEMPLKSKKPQMIFVNSMSDLFHKDVPLVFIQKIFDVMRKAKQHTFQILTKRSNRLLKLNSRIEWPQNVWMGVSVENQDYLYRIDHLKETDAFLKFISFEPLIGKIDKVNLSGIDWVIVGGESGIGSRIIKEEWITEIRDNCLNNQIPFFFKQWGGINKKKSGKILQGVIWNEHPKKEKILYKWISKFNDKIVPLRPIYPRQEYQVIMNFG